MRAHRSSPLALVVPFLVIATASHADTLTFQEGDGGSYSSTHATQISSGSGVNYGTGTVLTVVTFSTQALIRFPDLIGSNPGQVPAGSTINSASLTMTLYNVGNLVASNDIHEVYVPWDENTVTGAGFYALPAPQYGPVVGTLPFTDFGAPTSGDVTAIVQDWANGAANQGFTLHRRDPITPEEGTYITQYYSDDVATQTWRPKLTVDFTAPIVAVEPSTWGKVKALYR